MSPKLVSILQGSTATAIAIMLIILGAVAADRYQWPFIHGWALMHGTIFVVFPAYVLLSFLLLRPIARRLQNQGALAGSVKQQRISFLAILSVLSSSAGFLMPFVGSILGIAFGHFARRRCRAQLAVYGSGIALAGLILGYIGLAYSIYVIGMVSWVTSTNVS